MMLNGCGLHLEVEEKLEDQFLGNRKDVISIMIAGSNLAKKA